MEAEQRCTIAHPVTRWDSKDVDTCSCTILEGGRGTWKVHPGFQGLEGGGYPGRYITLVEGEGPWRGHLGSRVVPWKVHLGRRGVLWKVHPRRRERYPGRRERYLAPWLGVTTCSPAAWHPGTWV